MKMKKLVKFFAIVALLISCSFASQAQNPQKIGYVDLQSLLPLMPGIDSIKIKLQKYQQTLSDKMDAMRAEFDNKYLEFQNNSATMSDLIKQTTKKELDDLQARIGAFEQQANQDLQAKQGELVQPFIEKAKNAVAEVAKENKYTYILMQDALVYTDPTDDILPLVKKKLGIQ